MQAIIDIYRMTEISPKVRARIIISLGTAINCQLSDDITQELVYELVKTLDPDNKILTDEYYLRYVKGDI